MSTLNRLAAALAVAATVGALSVGTASAAIPEGAVGTVEVTCDTPDARLVFDFQNDSSGTVSITFTYTIDNGAPNVGIGYSDPGGGGTSSNGVQAGVEIDASISIDGDVADELVDFIVPNCLEQETTATITVACNDGSPELVIAFANTFDAAIIYNYGYDVWDGISSEGDEGNAEVDLETPFTLSVPLEAGDEVSAMVYYGDLILVQIDEEFAPDCSDDGSGAGLPDAGSNTTPLTLAAGALLGMGALLTFGVRRRRTA